MPDTNSAASTFWVTPLDILPDIDREGLTNSRAPFSN
jgi:hypothetical protein